MCVVDGARPGHAVERCARTDRRRVPHERARRLARWRDAHPRQDRTAASGRPDAERSNASNDRASADWRARRARALCMSRCFRFRSGLTLLWRDITERTAGGHARRSAAKSGSRSRPRARTTAGGSGTFARRSSTSRGGGGRSLASPGEAGVGRPEDWLDRVHPEDMASLKDALKAHLSGRRRISSTSTASATKTATYRSFLCRGIAARGTGRDRRRALPDRSPIRRDHARAQQQLRSAGFRDPLTGLAQSRGLRRRARTPARGIQAAASGRRTIRDSVSRPRPLQGGERQPRPSRRRRDAHRGVAPSRVVPARGRHARAPRRRRVRDSAADASATSSRRTSSPSAFRKR